MTSTAPPRAPATAVAAITGRSDIEAAAMRSTMVDAARNIVPASAARAAAMISAAPPSRINSVRNRPRRRMPADHCRSTSRPVAVEERWQRGKEPDDQPDRANRPGDRHRRGKEQGPIEHRRLRRQVVVDVVIAQEPRVEERDP